MLILGPLQAKPVSTVNQNGLETCISNTVAKSYYKTTFERQDTEMLEVAIDVFCFQVQAFQS